MMVALFFLVLHHKSGKKYSNLPQNIPYGLKIFLHFRPKMFFKNSWYYITNREKYSNLPQNIPYGRKILLHFPPKNLIFCIYDRAREKACGMIVFNKKHCCCIKKISKGFTTRKSRVD
jgi:hypothetical protein